MSQYSNFDKVVFLSFFTFFCLFFCSSVVLCEREVILYAGINNVTNKVDVMQVDDVEGVPKKAAVYGVFDNKINETGWSFLEIHSSAEYTDEQQSYAAGYVEGHLTHELIWMHWLNIMKDFCKGQEQICQKVENYIDKNQAWVNQMIAEKSDNSPYWYQVKLLMLQINGIVDGYNDANTIPERKLTNRDILHMNMDGDLEDLVPAFKGVGREFADSHCSALVKMLPDWSDVLVSHVTWSSFQSMLRIQKKYVLNIHTLKNSSKIVKGQNMSFPSYPGLVASGDDLYVMSSRLVTLETTIGNSNPNLWSNVMPEGQVLEFVRVMVANRLAGSGRTWVDTFKKFNSGTYNNQWMIVDYKKFFPGSSSGLKKDFLWIVEQIPGMTVVKDVTEVIQSQSYWPSYNIPYFPMIYNRSGWPDSVATHGEWFTYDKNPRAQIFKRDQGNVHDMDSMLELMTYNDFKHDPLSRCECDPPYSAENAISARNDLNLANGTYPFRALSHRSHGATDVKITNRLLSKDYRFLAVSGPIHNTSRGIPPFKWSETDFGTTTPHFGHPNEWTFKPITYKWLDN